MEHLIWDENKIKELNVWIEDDSASSIGAVLSELVNVVNIIEKGGQLIITKKGKQESIKDKEAFKNFISESLKNADYFTSKI